MVLEHDMQVSVMREVALRGNQDERWRLLTAIPNGGKRDKVTGAMLQAEGVQPGVLDLFWFLPMRGYKGFALELKVGRNQLTIEQSWWREKLLEEGYCVVVIWDEPALVLASLDWYIANGREPYALPLGDHLTRVQEGWQP